MGFSAGQVQYLDLIKKDTSKLFNEEVIVAPQVVLPFSPTSYTHTVGHYTGAHWGAVWA